MQYFLSQCGTFIFDVFKREWFQWHLVTICSSNSCKFYNFPRCHWSLLTTSGAQGGFFCSPPTPVFYQQCLSCISTTLWWILYLTCGYTEARKYRVGESSAVKPDCHPNYFLWNVSFYSKSRGPLLIWDQAELRKY